MVKRVISRISLSTFVLATGLFLWSNVNSTTSTSTTGAQIANNADGETICVPGTPDYPKCYFDKLKKKQ